MTKLLDEILVSLRNICDKEVIDSENFGIEFGTYSEHKLKATNVKCIITSPIMNLKLVHFMKDNNASLAITLLPLSITQTKFPLSERDFELLKALVTNNIKTIHLPEEWIYSQKGSFAYFLQTLGLTNVTATELTKIDAFPLIKWDTQNIAFGDYLTNLSHLNKNWFAYPFAHDDSNLSMVLERNSFSSTQLEFLQNEGVNTILPHRSLTDGNVYSVLFYAFSPLFFLYVFFYFLFFLFFSHSTFAIFYFCICFSISLFPISLHSSFISIVLTSSSKI